MALLNRPSLKSLVENEFLFGPAFASVLVYNIFLKGRTMNRGLKLRRVFMLCGLLLMTATDLAADRGQVYEDELRDVTASETYAAQNAQ